MPGMDQLQGLDIYFVLGAAGGPSKANPKLVVDANAVLSSPASLE